MKWDLKSIITLMLIGALVVVTLSLIYSMIFGNLGSDNATLNAIVILFSNAVTSVLTFYFTKKEKKDIEQGA